MGQIGHTDARLTLTVYAQIMQRQRIDERLIWTLMRFPDEPERPGTGRSFGPLIDPTGSSMASAGVGADRC